jgi:type II secretory pathway pseudopilin PulG
MIGGIEYQFCLTRAALSTWGRAKTKFSPALETLAQSSTSVNISVVPAPNRIRGCQAHTPGMLRECVFQANRRMPLGRKQERVREQNASVIESMTYKLQGVEEEPEKPARRNAGFTLIELVFVILSCALLVLLVAPAMARSGDGGKRAVCFNNLRQLGMAMIMYGNDNLDYLAQPNWDGGSTGTPAGWLYRVSSSTPDPFVAPWLHNGDSAWQTGLWFQYTCDPRIYLCPVDIQSPTYAKNQRNNELCSYVMNGAVNGFGGESRTCKLSDAWSPDCYLLWGPDENAVGPGNPGGFTFNDGSSFPATFEMLIEQLHTLGGGEVLTVGGAVQFVSVQKYTQESNASGKSLAWWSPFSSTGHF